MYSPSKPSGSLLRLPCYRDRTLNLLALQQKPAHNILVIEDHAKAGESLLSQHLLRSGAHVTCQYLPSHTHWTESVYNTPVPVQVLQAVVSWMVEAYP